MEHMSISEVGGSETNREIVSVRSHARTHARSGSEVRIGKKEARPVAFPFSIGPGRVSARELWCVLVSSSES